MISSPAGSLQCQQIGGAKGSINKTKKMTYKNPQHMQNTQTNSIIYPVEHIRQVMLKRTKSVLKNW